MISFFSKYANDTETIVDTAQTENSDVIDNTPFLTDKMTITDKSHTATLHENEIRASVPPSTTVRGRKAVSGTTTTVNATKFSANAATSDSETEGES